eukprot:Phypoly_transcript_14211.p1 GENE.Phypoly_transcript_14211~~Phypoly_transcript_14211.p1  ORF type:complete len:285 (+),score=76.72 Phypoly_transcript_14211:111-965(+)
MEGIEKLLKTSFAGAANQLTQLYVTSLQQQKQSYLAGHSAAIESVMDFVQSTNSSTIRVDTLMEFLRKEMQKPLLSTHATSNFNSTTTNTNINANNTNTNINTNNTNTNNHPSNIYNTNINTNNTNTNNHPNNINNTHTNNKNSVDSSLSLPNNFGNFTLRDQNNTTNNNNTSNLHNNINNNITNINNHSQNSKSHFGDTQPFSFTAPSSSHDLFFTRDNISAFPFSLDNTRQVQQTQQMQTSNTPTNPSTPTKKRHIGGEFVVPSTPPSELWDQLLKKVKIDL